MIEPRRVEVPSKQIVGISVETSADLEFKPETARIPGLWHQFLSEGILNTIPGRVDPGRHYGVYTQYQSDHRGAYTLVLGAEVEQHESILNDRTVVELQAGAYDVFEASGPMPQVVIDTWGAIWDYYEHTTEVRRRFTTDFELFQAESPETISIFIAVEPNESRH